MGRLQGDGFSPSRGWLPRAYMWAAHAHSGSQAHLSLGAPDPPLSCQTICTGSLGTCLETEAHPATQRTARFPMGHTSQQLSQLLRDSVCRKDWGPGAWAGDFPGCCLMARRPLSRDESPNHPLTPAGVLIPAISGPLATWGRDTWARCASNWPTWRQTNRHLRPDPTTAKIPLFFHL